MNEQAEESVQSGERVGAEPQQAKEVRRQEPSHYRTAMWIADQLEENEQGTRKHLISIVRALGPIHLT